MVTSNRNCSNSCLTSTRMCCEFSCWHQHNELRPQAPAWGQFSPQQLNLANLSVHTLCGLHTLMALVVTRLPKTSLQQKKASANKSAIVIVSFGMLFLLLSMQAVELQRLLTKCGTTVQDPQVSPQCLTACWTTGKDTGTMVESILCSTLAEELQGQQGGK